MARPGKPSGGGAAAAATRAWSATGKTRRSTCVADDVAAALRDLQLLDPDCERLVFRGRVHPQGAVLAATDAELEELAGAVAAEANHEPHRRRQQRLDAAFDALNDAATNSTSSW